MDRTRTDRVGDVLPRFPLRLLFAGYGTGGLAGLVVLLAGGGWLPAGLTFWLGGAAATLAWGAGQMFLCQRLRGGTGRPAEAPRSLTAAE